MTRSEVEEIVARARALVEAHERREPSYPYWTDNEATAIHVLDAALKQAFDATYARGQAA